jgi:hypothetical protein
MASTRCLSKTVAENRDRHSREWQLLAEERNRSRSRELRLSLVVFEGAAAWFRMLANEAIYLVLQQERNHTSQRNVSPLPQDAGKLQLSAHRVRVLPIPRGLA